MRPFLAVVVSVGLTAIAAVVQADQRRDYMLEGERFGNHLMVDYFGTGGQVTLAHRAPIYGRLNSYSVAVATLVGYPLGQATAEATLRFLFLELAGTIGYRAVWRNLSFDSGAHSYCVGCDRAARRHQDHVLEPASDTDKFPFAEAKLQLYAPFNDYFVLTSLISARYEGLKPRSYDWFYCDIHDPGVMLRWETLAFIKHRDWGGIGPYLQLLSLPRAGRHVPEWAVGFNVVTRLGLLTRNDLLFLTFLIRPGDPYYGQHNYFAPVRALLIYRMSFSL